MSRLISQYFCIKFEFLKKLYLPIGEVNNRIHYRPIAKSTIPGLSDTTFFALWADSKVKTKIGKLVMPNLLKAYI